MGKITGPPLLANHRQDLHTKIQGEYQKNGIQNTKHGYRNVSAAEDINEIFSRLEIEDENSEHELSDNVISTTVGTVTRCKNRPYSTEKNENQSNKSNTQENVEQVAKGPKRETHLTSSCMTNIKSGKVRKTCESVNQISHPSAFILQPSTSTGCKAEHSSEQMKYLITRYSNSTATEIQAVPMEMSYISVETNVETDRSFNLGQNDYQLNWNIQEDEQLDADSVLFFNNLQEPDLSSSRSQENVEMDNNVDVTMQFQPNATGFQATYTLDSVGTACSAMVEEIQFSELQINDSHTQVTAFNRSHDHSANQDIYSSATGETGLIVSDESVQIQPSSDLEVELRDWINKPVADWPIMYPLFWIYDQSKQLGVDFYDLSMQNFSDMTGKEFIKLSESEFSEKMDNHILAKHIWLELQKLNVSNVIENLITNFIVNGCPSDSEDKTPCDNLRSQFITLANGLIPNENAYLPETVLNVIIKGITESARMCSRQDDLVDNIAAVCCLGPSTSSLPSCQLVNHESTENNQCTSHSAKPVRCLTPDSAYCGSPRSERSFRASSTSSNEELPVKPRRRGRPPKIGDYGNVNSSLGNPLGKSKKEDSNEKDNHVWAFVLRLLLSKDTCPRLVRWEEGQMEKGLFRFVNGKECARLWGSRRGKDLSYDSFTRSLRHYYEKTEKQKNNNKVNRHPIMEPVKEHHVYKFLPIVMTPIIKALNKQTELKMATNLLEF